MKYARLLLKWMLPIGAILILLNGAYIGLQGFKVKDVEFVVKEKNEDIRRNGSVVYQVYLCPTSEGQCIWRQVRESAASKYQVDESITLPVKVIQIQGLGTVIYGTLTLLLVICVVVVILWALLEEFIVWVYKE